MQEMINRAKELLSDGTVNRVLGWRRGDMSYNPEPSYFETAEGFGRKLRLQRLLRREPQ